MCENVEDEKHVLTECPLYCKLRQDTVLFEICVGFKDMSDMDKACFILSSKNIHTVRVCAKYCYVLLERRRHFQFYSLS